MVARIKDVAKEANVSIATVSRVINNIPLVNEETRLRVLAAIKKTGYKPNAVARSLKLQKTFTIGVVLYDLTRTYYTVSVKGIQSVADENKYNITLADTNGNHDRETEFIEGFLQKQCDGLILLGSTLSDDVKSMLSEATAPVVLGFRADNDVNLSSVTFDDVKAAEDITQLLINNGHTDIGIICGDTMFSYFSARRYEGFSIAIKNAGLALNPDWKIESNFSVEGGYEAAKKLLKQDKRPSAIFCVNDDTAVGAMRAIEDAGLSVPDDISIVGVNDFAIGKWNKPALTTVRYDLFDFGQQCARLLFEEMKGGRNIKKNVSLGYEIIERDSVKKLN